jgi:hypothetical protein
MDLGHFDSLVGNISPVAGALVKRQWDHRRTKAGPALRKRKKRRAALEPKIGHLKSDNRVDRNYLKGPEGDRINALLAGIGSNFRKLLATFGPAPREFLQYALTCIAMRLKYRHLHCHDQLSAIAV